MAQPVSGGRTPEAGPVKSMATQNRLAWMIGGPQGSGVDSSARMFALACANGGLYLYGKREYYSNIKGEHSYFQIRVNERPIHSSIRDVHVLATFEPETLLRHVYSGEVIGGGAAIYDPGDLDTKIEKIGTLEYNVRQKILDELEEAGLEPTVGSVVKKLSDEKGMKRFEVPYEEILESIGEELGVKQFAKLQIIKNTICVGASFGALGYDLDVVIETVEDIFSAKSDRVKKMNRLAIEKGYNHIQENYGTIDYKLRKVERKDATRKLFLQGTQAVAMGKIAAGCRFQTYYPITPATDESEFLEGHPDGKVVVMQAEDEIAAMSMAIGAALSGARASTSTSGPGFNLMVEPFGWSGINEVPIVLINYQRGGPSTGLPTRHEQGDLKFALNAGHGDFPRIVHSPGDLEEAFWGAVDSFNWAEKYQMPVVFLPDKNLANNSILVDDFEFEKVRIDRGKLLADDKVEEHVSRNGGDYFERFSFEEDGVSPRSVLGQKHGIHWLTGDEHDPRGHITEDPTIRIKMMNKRQAKLDLAAKEIPRDKKLGFYGPEDADLTIVSWGSNKGAIIDAMHALKDDDGPTVNFLHVKLLNPFPTEEVTEILDKANKTVLIEQNFSGQLGGWIRENTGIDMDHKILKFTGRPMTEDEIVDTIRSIASGKAEAKEVLTHGV